MSRTTTMKAELNRAFAAPEESYKLRWQVGTLWCVLRSLKKKDMNGG